MVVNRFFCEFYLEILLISLLRECSCLISQNPFADFNKATKTTYSTNAPRMTPTMILNTYFCFPPNYCFTLKFSFWLFIVSTQEYWFNRVFGTIFSFVLHFFSVFFFQTLLQYFDFNFHHWVETLLFLLKYIKRIGLDDVLNVSKLISFISIFLIEELADRIFWKFSAIQMRIFFDMMNKWKKYTCKSCEEFNYL